MQGGVVVCGAGCTLAQLNEHVCRSGYVVPLDLGPKDVCQIGGNLASNAGGLRFLRYGSLRGSVTGIEVWLVHACDLHLARQPNSAANTAQPLASFHVSSVAGERSAAGLTAGRAGRWHHPRLSQDGAQG